jgi:hypothetical protein
MKFFTMWHPDRKWGAVVPTLLPRKQNAVQGTGLTLRKMRELGWQWVIVEVKEPVPMTPAETLAVLRAQIDDLTMEFADLTAQVIGPKVETLQEKHDRLTELIDELIKEKTEVVQAIIAEADQAWGLGDSGAGQGVKD